MDTRIALARDRLLKNERQVDRERGAERVVDDKARPHRFAVGVTGLLHHERLVDGTEDRHIEISDDEVGGLNVEILHGALVARKHDLAVRVVST